MGIFDNLKSLVNANPSAATPQAPATLVPPKKVLIVEDDQYIRDLYVEILKSNGFEVYSAVNGEQGLQAVQTYKPDLLLLDLMMPIMDGKTMLHKLRQIPEFAKLPVIILTNSGDADSMTQTQLYENAKGFLIKVNTTPQEVLNRVKGLLSS